VALAVATDPKRPGAVDRVDCQAYDWGALRAKLQGWIAALPEGGAAALDEPVNHELFLRVSAKPRSDAMRGVRRWPSFNLAGTAPFPTLHFADGRTADLGSLTLFEVQELADGEARLAIEQPSHQEAWAALLEIMLLHGAPDTSALNRLEVEVYAAMLGLTESPTGELGDFDEGWRAINRLPSRFDGPRHED
jgi:hypothetical protein